MIRPLRPLYRQDVCYICRRALSASATRNSGHNKWSKIKHDKAANDIKRNRQNSMLSEDIARAVREGGSADPGQNPQLASYIDIAKKSSFPKSSIEAAILRGEGKSSSGKPIETVQFEAICQGAVGLIFECETDNKTKTLTLVRGILKKNDAKWVPTEYLFSRRGRIGISSERDDALEHVMDEAIEAGALDVVEESSNEFTVYTEPSGLMAVRNRLAASEGISIDSMETSWVPNEETWAQGVDEEQFDSINALAKILVEEPGINVVYSNMGHKSMGRLPLES